MAQAVAKAEAPSGGVERPPTQAALARRAADLLNATALMLMQNNAPSLPWGPHRRISLSFLSSPLLVPECAVLPPAEGSSTVPLLASAELMTTSSPGTKPAARSLVLAGYSHSQVYYRDGQAITEHDPWEVRIRVSTMRRPCVEVAAHRVPMADRWREYYGISPDDPDYADKMAAYHRAAWQYETLDEGGEELPPPPPLAEGKLRLYLRGADRCTPEDVRQVETYLALFGRAVTAYIDA